MLCSIITSFPGSSKYFLGGVVSYSNDSKEKVLGADKAMMIDRGAVSEETAVEMAEGVRKLYGSDISASITGIAGPGGGTAEKPVGLVWIGISSKNGAFAKKFNFAGGRDAVRKDAANAAVVLLTDLADSHPR
jgi:nicotinamide-nucleotide amidase